MKTTMIVVPLAILLLVFFLAGCGGGGGGGNTTDTVPPVISNPEITLPPYFSFPGGNVTITANVTDNVGVSSVTVRVQNSFDGSITNKTLTKTTVNTYQGAVSVLYSGIEAGTQTFTVTVIANDTSGNSSNKTAGTVTIELEGPPPLPQ